MPISEEHVTKFQKLYEEKYGEKLTRQEAYDVGSRLVNFFELLLKIDYRNRQRREKLKQYPKGFHLTGEGTYNCGICHCYVSDDQTWYDKWGIKCIPCQKATEQKIIPGRICHNDKLWYAMWEMDSYFKLKRQTVLKLVRQGVLKARIIPDSNFYVFMISDNVDVLPSKHLVKDVAREIEPGTIEVRSWYDVKDPAEMLNGYKIWPHLMNLK